MALHPTSIAMSLAGLAALPWWAPRRPSGPAGASAIPRDPQLDGTYALMRDGYLFISNRCRRLGTDVFETRLLLQTSSA